MTTNAHPALRPAPAPAARHTGIPFSRLLGTELRKLRDTRAGRWLLIVILVTTPLVVVVMLFTTAPGDLTYTKLVDFTQAPQKYLLPVVGILAVTSEWSQRTGLVTFTLEPDRKRVLLAKGGAAMLLGLLMVVNTLVSAAIGNLLGVALRGGDGSWAFGPGGLADITLVLLSGLALGLAFGMLLLNSAGAIIAFYVLPNLSSVLFNAVHGLKGVSHWLDLNLAQGPLYDHGLSGHQWAQLSTATLVWVVLPAALGTVRVLRSEVTSG
jgi:hypothetical protein